MNLKLKIDNHSTWYSFTLKTTYMACGVWMSVYTNLFVYCFFYIAKFHFTRLKIMNSFIQYSC